MADIDDEGLRPYDQPEDAVRSSDESAPLTSALAIDAPLASMMDSTHENANHPLSPSSLETTTYHGGDSPSRVSTETIDGSHSTEHIESRKRRSNDVRHTFSNDTSKHVKCNAASSTATPSHEQTSETITARKVPDKKSLPHNPSKTINRHGIHNKEGAVERTNSNQEFEQHAEKVFVVLETHAEQLKNELTSQAERHKNDIDRHAVEIQQELQRQAEGNTAVFSEKKKQELRIRLAMFYQDEYKNMKFVPALEEKEVEMDVLYVPPKIVHNNTRVRTFKDFFMKDGKVCKNIFVVGEPGTGKSTFTQNIALQWSELQLDRASLEKYSLSENHETADHNESTANRTEFTIYSRDSTAENRETTAEKENESTETGDFQDKDTLSMIHFLFHVRLRDANAHCQYVNIIRDQILVHLYPQGDKLERTFSLVQCLLEDPKSFIVSDGLDEWAHPSERACAGTLPSDTECLCPSDMKGRTPFIPLHSATLVTTSRPWRLAQNPPVDSKIKKRMDIEGTGDVGKLGGNMVKILNEQTGKNEKFPEIESYVRRNKTTSLLHTPILLLQIVCLFFEGKEVCGSKCKIYASIIDMLIGRNPHGTPAERSVDVTPPACFAENLNVKRCWTIIVNLAKEAFEKLFPKSRHAAVVFCSSACALNEEDKAFALRCGILSAKKSTFLSRRESHLSFMHKTFQEFLSAIHISNNEDAIEHIIKPRYVPSDSNSLHLCLSDLSQVFIFLCGMNKTKAEQLSKLMNDHLSTCLKTASSNEETYEHVLTNLVRDGIVEAENNGVTGFSPCLQYLALRRDNLSICHNLTRYELKLVTLDISGDYSGEYLRVCKLPLTKCTQLQKLTLKHVTIDEPLILSDGIVNFQLYRVELKRGISIENCPKLQKFIYRNGYCYGREFKQEEYTLLPGGLTLQNCQSLEKLELEHVDLGGHELIVPTHIKELKLKDVKLPRLPLDYCTQLKKLCINNVTLRADFSLQQCKYLNKLKLGSITVGESDLKLPPSITDINMDNVTLSSRSLLCLVEFLETLPHAVKCELSLCKVEPIIEHCMIRQRLNSSKCLNVAGYEVCASTGKMSFTCDKL